jgi:UPF0716 protein FxsA
MFWKLLLAFTVIPALELYLLVSVGQWIGPLATVLLIVLTGLIGAALAKREGLAVLAQLKGDLQRGLPPASHLVEGAMVLAGGLLLLTPGLLTDLAGFSLIFPTTRRLLAPALSRWLSKRLNVQVGGAGVQLGTPPAPGGSRRPTQRAPTPPVNESGGTPFDHPMS